MTKTRVQLSAIACLLGYFGYLLLASLTYKTAALMFLDVTLLITALGILTCTFIRAKKLQNGSVCFMPNHPLVKLGFVTKEGTNLCPTFWIIGTIITYISFLALIVILILVGIIAETASGNFVEGVAIPASVIIGFSSILYLVVWLATNDSWVWNVPAIVLGIALALVFFYLLPMANIAKSHSIDLSNGEAWITGTVIYLKWLGAIVASVAIAVGMIYLAFKHWSVLSSSWLGQQIALLKEKLCVRFVECSQG